MSETLNPNLNQEPFGKPINIHFQSIENSAVNVGEIYDNPGTSINWGEHPSTSSPVDSTGNKRRALITADDEHYLLLGSTLYDITASEKAGNLEIALSDIQPVPNLVIGEPSIFSNHKSVRHVLIAGTSEEAHKDSHELDSDPFERAMNVINTLASVKPPTAQTHERRRRKPIMEFDGDIKIIDHNYSVRVKDYGTGNTALPKDKRLIEAAAEQLTSRHGVPLSPQPPSADRSYDYQPRLTEEAKQQTIEAAKKTKQAGSKIGQMGLLSKFSLGRLRNTRTTAANGSPKGPSSKRKL